MNKKVLVIALALVVAFATSAMASVDFSGEFSFTAETDSFFADGYELSTNLGIDIDVSNKHEEDEVLSWEFGAGVSLVDSVFELGKYKLSLYDDYFKAYVWGNGEELSDKGTPFGFVKAGKVADDIRARVEVPVLDLADITLDFEPEDNLRAFLEGKVEGFDVGLGYALTDWSDEDELLNTLAVYGKGGVEGINVKAEAGFKLGEDLGLAFGFGADTLIVDELKVEGSVKYQDEKWAGEQTTDLTGKATYTEAEFQASVEGQLTLKDENENAITLDAKYRMSDAVAYGDLFHADHWFKNDGPAFGVSAKFADLEFDNVRVDAASPVVDDLVWVKAYASYNADKEVAAEVLGRVLATNKLTLHPRVEYKEEKVTAELKADYKIGLSDTTLSVAASQVIEEDGDGSLKASVKVPF